MPASAAACIRARRWRPRPTSSMFTRAGVERIMRFAFKLAQSRPRKLLTVVTKSNAQRHAMVMWDEIARRGRARVPGRDLGQDAGRRHDHAHGDAARRRIDTIVATNLHADILSDLAAALAGSLGIAPTANLNPERDFPVDVRADPRLGLRHHGQGHRQSDRHVLVGGDDARASGGKRRRRAPDAGDRARHRRPALHTPDLGGSAKTRKVTDAVVTAIRAENA